MNYLEWNNVIINHFFNQQNEEKEVILYFSEDVVKEIGEENFPLPDEGYVENFFHALRKGVCGTQNSDYIQRILDLENRYSQGCLGIDNIPFNYPPYLTYLLAFMLPFTSGDIITDLNINNFHTNAKKYFEEKNLCSNYKNQIEHKLKLIDHLWNKIINWLFEENNFSLGIIATIDNPVSTRKYVSKFEYHIIFRKEQEDKLSVIFDNNNILPNEPLDGSIIKQLLIDNARELRLTNDTITKIRTDEYIGKKLVKRALDYYKNWDGTNRYDYTKISGDTTSQRGFSRKRIILCVEFYSLLQKIEVKHFRLYSGDGFPEEFTLFDSTNKEYQGVGQSSQNFLYSTVITDCFQNLNQGIELKDKSNRIKYTWKSKRFYLFKRDSQLGDWVEIPQIEFNTSKTLIIAENEFYEANLKSWFESDSITLTHKKIYKENTKNNLPDGWLALTIEQITKYQHPFIPELITRPETKPEINFNKEFFFDACFYSDTLPYLNVWVENCEVEDEDQIVAEYRENVSIPLQREDSNFQFTNEHIQRKNQDFKLKYNNIEYQRFVKIIDFEKKKTNEEIGGIQPKRNLISNIFKSYENPVNYFQGIEHCFDNATIQRMKPTQRNPVTQKCIFINIRDANSFNQNCNYDKTLKGNILLNYISAKGKILKVDYDSAVLRLIQDSEEKENLKKLIRYSLYDLQNLGYVDYDAERGIIYINKSSLVVKPTESGTTLLLVGARDNKFVQSIIDYSKNGSCYIDIQDSAEDLLPQTILIKFKKCNHTIVNDFATHFKLQFKHEQQLFTQFALANAHKISDWANFVNKAKDMNFVSDFEGGQIFDIETLRFKEKLEYFDKSIEFIRFDLGHKKAYRLWYKNEAYLIAELHYGLYLYLFLYRQLKTEQYNTEKEQGEINRFEYNEKVSSLKTLTNFLLYDESKKWLGVPLNCALPKYYAIAFTLLSGKKPEIHEHNNRKYLIYKNVPFLFCQNSLVIALNQNINRIEF